MRYLFIFFSLLCLFSLPSVSVLAEDKDDLIIDAALDQVDITTGFDGAKLVVYGVKRVDGDLAIVVRGPDKYHTVRKKDQIMGVWMNVEAIEFKNVSSYYDYAVSANETKLAEVSLLQENKVGLNALSYEVADDDEDPEEVRAFHESLIRLQQGSGLLPLEAQPVRYLDDGFFKVVFDLPANVPIGLFQIEGFVFDDGDIVAKDTIDLNVGQVGLSANIYKFAHTQPWMYAIVILLIASASGLFAHYAMRKG